MSAAAPTPALFPAARLNLRAKAVIAFTAVVLYFIASGVVLSLQRSKTITFVEQLETLSQVEATLARVNMTTSQTVLKINQGDPVVPPAQTVEAIALDVQALSAGLGALGAYYPRAGAMRERLATGLDHARRSGDRESLGEMRDMLRDLAFELDRLTREVRVRHERMWSGYRATYDSVTLIAATLFMLGIAVFGGIVMVFFRRLAWDVRALSERAVEVMRGYRGEPLRVTRRDEVGALMDAVNRMQHILRAREREVEVSRQQRFHQEKMAAIGSLAAAVAHEINNPIAAIEGVAQTIGEECPNCGNCGDLPRPQLILEHTRRIVGITRQLSELTSPHSTEPEWTDLNALARNTCAFVSYDKRFRDVRLDVALDPSIPAAWAVADHATQVLMNLLLNAADAVSGAAVKQIRVATRAAGERVELSVADTGQGMAPEVLARAFEEGFTTKAEGSGIGLFMCRTLIERGGGNIALESRVGAGTTVTVSLPTHPVPEAPPG